jgi:uncharacterized small protein (DUF1192 family)
MDWDDLKPKQARPIEVGEPLAAMSVDELQARIVALQAEIARVGDELQRKQSVQAAAKAAFKS